jgi:hypothetical protein
MQGVGITAIHFAWPLLMFFSAITFIGIGIVHLLSATAHSIFCYQAGRQSDKQGNGLIAQFGVLGHGMTLIGRAFITSIIGASFWQIFGGIFGGFHYIPIETGFYKRSHHDLYNSILNRELYLHFGRIFFFILIIVLSNILTVGLALRLVLIIAGVLVSLIFFIIPKDNTIIR